MAPWVRRSSSAARVKVRCRAADSKARSAASGGRWRTMRELLAPLTLGAKRLSLAPSFRRITFRCDVEQVSRGERPHHPALQFPGVRQFLQSPAAADAAPGAV